ncbi:hypothetical protein [Vibrio vulnificus YJ016]|uniref:Uncharacterized protein n=1 Tax=Vibrio vulnificus (strain YJ016) TaxID=196600 RepID=Q7MQ60_VIBVY|nr:hypothetical protein [Vibrio vulnificus YJ016]
MNVIYEKAGVVCNWAVYIGSQWMLNNEREKSSNVFGGTLCSSQ